MADPEVVRTTAEGDAAMEAGDFDRAYEIYAEAKRLRDELMPQPEGEAEYIFDAPGDMPAVGALGLSGGNSPPRRSVADALPARKQLANGAPTKEDEVAARIAARNAGAGR